MILPELITNLFYLLCAIILLVLIAVVVTLGVLVLVNAVKSFRESDTETENKVKENNNVESK